MKLRKTYWLLVLLVITCLLPSVIRADFLDSVSLTMEKEIGYQTYNDIVAQKEVVKLSPGDEAHLNSVFNKLVSQSPRRNEIKYSITVVRDNTVNAFALPAGYVFVHTGLLSYVRSDGELAGVLAHEVAHVDRRHSMKAITRQVGVSFILQMVISRGNSDHGKQIGRLGGVALNLSQLGYSRDAEYQADSYGVSFMRRAGYNKQELLNFWKRMDGQSGGGKDSSFLKYFSTHPPTGERIKRIETM